MISETEARAGIVGSRRFIVRGRVRMADIDAATLRAKYNEYPEREAWSSRFPAAGRRGGSRPALQQDGAEADLGGASPSGSPQLEPVPYSPYPVERPDGGRQSVPLSTKSVIPIAARAPLVFDPCEGEGGSWARIKLAPGGGEGCVVSAAISRPFVITHVQTWGEFADPVITSAVNVGLLVSQDAGAQTTWPTVTGTDVFPFGDKNSADDTKLSVQSAKMDRFPGFIQRLVPAYLKVRYYNQNGTANKFWVSVSWRYLA